MSLAVDKPILNNPFEEFRDYSGYEEGQLKKTSGKVSGGLFIESNKRRIKHESL
jgi:hypothetical protein